MDPNTTLRDILSSLAEGDGTEAAERLRDLADWLDSGGFCPAVDSDIVSLVG